MQFYGPPCENTISVQIEFAPLAPFFDNAISEVQMNDSTGEWFRTTVGVRQGCLLSSTLFNIFFERIMSDALEEHDGKVSIGGEPSPICSLPMAQMLLLKNSKN